MNMESFLINIQTKLMFASKSTELLLNLKTMTASNKIKSVLNFYF